MKQAERELVLLNGYSSGLRKGALAVRHQRFEQAIAYLTPFLSSEQMPGVVSAAYQLGFAWRGLDQRAAAAGAFARAMNAALALGRERQAERCRTQLIWELLSLRHFAAATALLAESAQYGITHPEDQLAQLRHANSQARQELLAGRPLEAANHAIEVAARAHTADRLLALETLLLASTDLDIGCM